MCACVCRAKCIIIILVVCYDLSFNALLSMLLQHMIHIFSSVCIDFIQFHLILSFNFPVLFHHTPLNSIFSHFAFSQDLRKGTKRVEPSSKSSLASMTTYIQYYHRRLLTFFMPKDNAYD